MCIRDSLWIEHASDIEKEYYASFTLDRPNKLHLGMLSAEGGVEIEEVAVTNPDAIAMVHINPLDGLDEGTARDWVDRANLDPEAREQAATLLVRLYHCYVEGDCDLAEINPLILTPEGKDVYKRQGRGHLRLFRPESEDGAHDPESRRPRSHHIGGDARLMLRRRRGHGASDAR